MTQISSTIKLPPVEQIGIVVRDINAAIDYYNSTFGWGPFHVMEVELKKFTYKDKIGNCRLKLAFARSGPIEIELIEVLEGETPHAEFLREKGEGVQHLRFRVENIDHMLAELAKAGVKPVFFKLDPQSGISFAYIHSDRIGGVMFELLETKPQRGATPTKR